MMRLISKMNTIWSLLLLNFIISSIVFPQLNQITVDLPFGLQEGDYAQYIQEFSTGEIHQLQWKITHIYSSLAEIQIISHGVRFNFTTLSFSIISGGGIMIISLSNWEIQQFRFLNGTGMPEQYIGYKVPFWVPTPITETTQINTLYDLNVTPILAGPLEFDCLPTPRLCWITDNHYSSNAWMQRYYDATTGIVLKIISFIQVFNSQISIVETLNDTNISVLQQIPASTPSLLEIGLGIITFTFVVAIILVTWYRRRAQSE